MNFRADEFNTPQSFRKQQAIKKIAQEVERWFCAQKLDIKQHDKISSKSASGTGKIDNVVAFYSDFSKAFDLVPHRLLLENCASIGVGGCFLEILHDYLSGREQFVRMISRSSATLEVTSGVPQRSLLGALLFCIFINDLPDLLKFSESFIFADDLKLLFTGKADWQIQEDLNSIQHWVLTNKMDLAIEKCAAVKNHHHSGDLMLGTSQLHSADSIKGLGIFVTNDMTWSLHVSESQQGSLPAPKKRIAESQFVCQTRTFQIYSPANTALRNELRTVEPWFNQRLRELSKTCLELGLL